MISQMYRESARIHAADSGNAVCLEIFFERLIGAKIGRLRIITDYQTGKKQSARLHVFAVHSVIADFGNGQSDELSGVGRIGKDLLIAAHTRIEDNLTASFNGRAKGDSVEYRPVLQREERLAFALRLPSFFKCFNRHRSASACFLRLFFSSFFHYGFPDSS